MRGDGDVVRDRDGGDERCDVLRTSAVQYVVHFIQSGHRAGGNISGSTLSEKEFLEKIF